MPANIPDADGMLLPRESVDFKKILNACSKYVLIIMVLGISVVIALLYRQVSSLNVRLNSYDAFFHSGQIARLSDSVSTIGTRLTSAEQKINALNHLSASFAQTSSSLKSQQQQLESLSSSLSQLRQSLAQSNDRVQRLESTAALASKTTADLADSLKSIMATVQHAAMSQKGMIKPPVSGAKRIYPRQPHTTTASLPFVLKAIEQRGGRPFAVIGPSELTAVSQLQLLSPGDEMQGWTLQSIEGSQGAVFMHNGAMHRVQLQ